MLKKEVLIWKFVENILLAKISWVNVNGSSCS